MPNRDIVVIGASAGGISAVGELLATLRPPLDGSLFVVIHTSPDGAGLLPAVLARGNAWPIGYGEDGERFETSHVYVAPPDHHMLIKPGRLQIVRGPRENRFRPAVDPLFRTAAESYGSRVIGIVLTGSLDDGTHGLELVKRHGGIAIVQDPAEAMAPSMPLSAIQNVEVDHILRVAEIARRLPAIVAESVAAQPARTRGAPDVAEGTATNQRRWGGRPSDLTCPECGGALRELEGGNVMRFRCHVGHGYTADSLLADQSDGLENVFWSALRALEEHSMLRRRMSEHAQEAGRADAAKVFEREAREIELRASAIRRILHEQRPTDIQGEALITANATRRRSKRAAATVRPGTRTRRENR